MPRPNRACAAVGYLGGGEGGIIVDFVDGVFVQVVRAR